MKGKFIKDNLYAVQQVVSATVFLISYLEDLCKMSTGYLLYYTSSSWRYVPGWFGCDSCYCNEMVMKWRR